MAVFTTSAGVMLNARRRQMPGMVVVAVTHWLLIRCVPMISDNAAFASLITSFTTCLFAEEISGWTGQLVGILLTPALFVAVPGGMLANWALLLALEFENSHDSDGNPLMKELYHIFEVAIGCSVGLALASLLSRGHNDRHPACFCQGIGW